MMINRELIYKKKERLSKLMVAVFDGDTEEIQRLIQESIKEDIDLLDTEVPSFFPGKPVKSILEYALKVSESEAAETLINIGAKIDENIRTIIVDRFPTLSRYLPHKS